MLKRRPIKNVHIYVLKDPETGEVRYVGKTKVTLEQRLNNHLCRKSNDHKGCWIKSLKNRNLTPIIESIEKVSDETWQEREIFWIRHYRELGAKLVNGNDGGLGGHNPTAETRARIAAANKGRITSDETCAKISSSNKGRTTSEETRAKLSAKTISAEHRAKISAAQKGKILSTETRAKLSAANKGKTLPTETRAKLSAANKGKTLSTEHREKISAANKGKLRSAESRAKMSAAAQNRKHSKRKTKFDKFLPLLEILKKPNCE